MTYTNGFTGVRGSPTSTANMNQEFDALAAEISALSDLVGGSTALKVSQGQEMTTDVGSPSARAAKLFRFGDPSSGYSHTDSPLPTQPSQYNRVLRANNTGSRTKDSTTKISYVSFSQGTSGLGSSAWTTSDPASAGGTHFVFPETGVYWMSYRCFYDSTGATDNNLCLAWLEVHDIDSDSVNTAWENDITYSRLSVNTGYQGRTNGFLEFDFLLTMSALFNCTSVGNQAVSVVEQVTTTGPELTVSGEQLLVMKL